jgi:hypothetical protein
MDTSKRKFLKWTPPLIIAVTLPKSGFASNISGHHEIKPRRKWWHFWR